MAIFYAGVRPFKDGSFPTSLGNSQLDFENFSLQNILHSVWLLSNHSAFVQLRSFYFSFWIFPICVESFLENLLSSS